MRDGHTVWVMSDTTMERETLRCKVVRRLFSNDTFYADVCVNSVYKSRHQKWAAASLEGGQTGFSALLIKKTRLREAGRCPWTLVCLVCDEWIEGV